VIRATDLGDFLPFERLFTMAKLKLQMYPTFWGVLLSSERGDEQFFTKNVLGYILGYFFTNSSGHPVRDQPHVGT
jgi:hypothetical protein